MPRYFFDVHDASGFTRDEFGDEFDSLEDARVQAQSLLPDIAREEQPGRDCHQISCDVRDEAGATVYRGKLIYEGTRFETT